MKISKPNLALLGVLTLVSSCASQQIADTRHIDAAVMQQVASSTQTPQQVCEMANQAMARANKEQLNFFAPLHFEQATVNLQQGHKLIKKRKTESEGIKACFKVSNLVDNGIRLKAKVKSVLSNSLQELNMLKKLDEANKFSDDIQDYVEDIIDLIKQIESGKMNQAIEDQAGLIQKMQALEIEIVMYNNITPVEVMLEKAEDADADDLAELTFEKAEKELESARKYIRANYRNAEQVRSTSIAAMRAAKHALYVAKEVESLKNLKPEAAEQKVLFIESLFENINKKFNDDKVVGNSLYDQSIIISERLIKVMDANESLLREISSLKNPQQDSSSSVEDVDEKMINPRDQATDGEIPNDLVPEIEQ